MYVASFNGVNANVSIPTTGFPTGNSPVTLEAWVYENNLAKRYYVVGYGGSSSNTEFRMFLNDFSPGQFSLETCGNGWTSSASLSPKTWYHLVITYNGSGSPSFYVNGIKYPVASTWGTPSVNIALGGGSIGNRGSCGGGYYMNGSIANVQIYSTALTPQEIQYLYQQGLGGGPIRLGSLVGWWPLNGDAKDYSGNNNHGTINGGVTFVQNYNPP